MARFTDGKPRRVRRNFPGRSLQFSLALFAILLFSLVRITESKSASPRAAATRTTGDTLESKIAELSISPKQYPSSYKPIVISDREANEYLVNHGPEFLPPGVENPQVQIYADRVTGSALVDFDQLQAIGKQTNDIGMQVVGTLFKGKQKVSATGKLSSGDGQAQVTVQDLSVGDTSIPDWLTRAMLQSYLEKSYKLDLSKPFPLPDHVTRIDLSTGQATFVRSPAKKPALSKQP
jgi:hypothetical protein